MTKPTFTTPIGQALWDVHSPTHPDRLITTEQAAHIARLKKTYLETLRSRGGGPEFIRYGSRIFYELPALIHWIEDRMEHVK